MIGLNHMKNIKYTILSLFALFALASAVPAFADSTTPTTTSPNSTMGGGMGGLKRGGMGMMKPGVFGKVTAVNGNTITVDGKKGFGTTATDVTYTVDATNAKVMKAQAASTVSAIAVGDTIMAQGTLTGTNLVATMIRDGVIVRTPGQNKTELATNIVGNGDPLVAGTVSSVDGSTLVITNKSNVSYSIDVSNAKITKGPAVSTISGVAVGDTVIVQGTINGTNVVASSVIDQAKPGTDANGQPKKGFFGGIGSFFAHIFGF